MWQPRTIERPSDPHATEIVVTLAVRARATSRPTPSSRSGARTVGEERDGEPIRLTGPLGHVDAGRAARLRRRRSPSTPKHGWQFVVAVVPVGAAAVRARASCSGSPPRARDRAHVRAGDRRPLRRRRASSRSSTAIRSGCARCARGRGGAISAQERRARDRRLARGRDDPRGRGVPLHARHQRRARRAARAALRRRGRRRADPRDPYRLTELPRIGFKIADRIAQSLGIEPDDAAARLRAGLRFVARGGGVGRQHVPRPGRSSGAQRAAAPRRRRPGARSSRRCTRSSARPRSSSRASASTGRELCEMERRLGEALGPRAQARRRAQLFDEPSPPGQRRLGRAVERRRARAHAPARPADRAAGRRQDAHAARARRHRAPGAPARPALRADRQGGAADARPDRPRRDDDPPRARRTRRARGLPARRGQPALARLRPRDRRRGVDALARARGRALRAPPATATSCSSATPTSCRRSGPGACSPTSSRAASCRAST